MPAVLIPLVGRQFDSIFQAYTRNNFFWRRACCLRVPKTARAESVIAENFIRGILGSRHAWGNVRICLLARAVSPLDVMMARIRDIFGIQPRPIKKKYNQGLSTRFSFLN